MYTLVLCAEMEVGKSAIYALLSRCRECRDLRALGAKKNVNPGIRARKKEIPALHMWKNVQHDNSVTWLASWTENIQGQIKYIMLNPSSRLKGEKDWQKYEKARKLKGEIEKIREDYMADMKSKEMRVRQRAVALYFIDKLALRSLFNISNSNINQHSCFDPHPQGWQ